MRGITGTVLVALLLSAVVDMNARAQTITAASCSASDVRNALNQAVDGDTVNIPAGTCRWTTQVSWTAPPNVTLRGAGDSSIGGGDRTVIVDDYAATTTLLSITTNASGTFRMTGITIQGGSGLLKQNRVLSIWGLSKQMRIDHIHIDTSTYTPTNTSGAMRVGGWVNGVIDHSIFKAYQGIDIWYTGYENGGGRSEGDGAWAAATGLGGGDFVFIEDNEFSWVTNNGGANDCSHGGKWVFRYNTLSKSVQTHPTGGSGRGRGCRAWEVYGNTFSRSNDSSTFNVFFLSSGTGVVWGNTALTGYKHFLTLHSMRKDNGTYSETATPNGWGYCGTDFNGTGSNWDGNTSAASGYPCLDQPGRGKGDLLSGAFPNVTNMATNCTASSPCAAPRQALEPIYEWGNTWAALPNNGASVFLSVAHPSVLSQNRDYYLQASPFTGTAGTGTGTVATRPSTCTTGVAYWATDQQTLYKCTATNTWTVYYKPYTYPHPLTQGAQLTPSAPTNLRIVR